MLTLLYNIVVLKNVGNVNFLENSIQGPYIIRDKINHKFILTVFILDYSF